MEEKKTKRKLKKTELGLYVASGLIGLTGIALIITGIVGTHLGTQQADNPIAQSEEVLLASTGIGFRWWGVIALILGAVIASVALSAYAKREDRDEERNARRRERMQILSESAAPIEGEAKEVAPDGSEALPEGEKGKETTPEAEAK